MDDQAESSQRAPPMTPPPPPPPSPALPEDSSSEVILWAPSDDCLSSTPHTDLLSLWLSNYTALPQPEAEEEPLADVSTLLNFDLESSFPDLVEWNTTNAAVTQVPVVTEPLWVQLHVTVAGGVDDMSGLALGIQSPIPSISPVAQGIQSPNASISPLALGIQFPEASVLPLAPGKQSPQASTSPLAPGIQPPQASSGIETLQASLSPRARGIQFPQASISPPISPPAPRIQSPQTSLGIQSAPTSFSSLPSILCTSPMAPLLGNVVPSPSLVPKRRSWSVFPSTPALAWQHLLLPHSASSSVSSPSNHPSLETHHFFPSANTGYQQQVPVAHASATLSTPNANANSNSSAGFVPASGPSWSQAMAPHGSSSPNQPRISNGKDMKLPIPRRPQFLLPPAATTMPVPPPLLANFGISVGNMPTWNARGDVPFEDHQRVQTVQSGQSSKPSRKKSKQSKLGVRIDNKLISK